MLAVGVATVLTCLVNKSSLASPTLTAYLSLLKGMFWQIGGQSESGINH